jgi:hypothetical protein
MTARRQELLAYHYPGVIDITSRSTRLDNIIANCKRGPRRCLRRHGPGD